MIEAASENSANIVPVYEDSDWHAVDLCFITHYANATPPNYVAERSPPSALRPILYVLVETHLFHVNLGT